MDELDTTLLQLLRDNPRVGVLELSRLAGVARGTISARLQRMHEAGVITGYGPDIDLVAAGYPVMAFVTLEIAQGRLDDVEALLRGIPGVLDAYATTGTSDVVCRVAAASNDRLQRTLLELNRSDAIRRSTSVVVLSTVVPPRVLPLLLDDERPRSRRAAAGGPRSGT